LRELAISRSVVLPRLARIAKTDVSCRVFKPGVPPGDVVFILKTAQHSTFERSDVDLLTKVKITLSEALMGFSRILLTHLDGKPSDRYHYPETDD
jgi:DnaJ-class molecular chaperone